MDGVLVGNYFRVMRILCVFPHIMHNCPGEARVINIDGYDDVRVTMGSITSSMKRMISNKWWVG